MKSALTEDFDFLKNELQALKGEIKKQLSGESFGDRPNENYNARHGDRNVYLVSRGDGFADHGKFPEDGGGRAPGQM